ncbi:hypothetical protein ACFLZN_02815 [Nanoarchaeota archaeon]
MAKKRKKSIKASKNSRKAIKNKPSTGHISGHTLVVVGIPLVLYGFWLKHIPMIGIGVFYMIASFFVDLHELRRIIFGGPLKKMLSYTGFFIAGLGLWHQEGMIILIGVAALVLEVIYALIVEMQKK